jgi:cobalt transporter subunit CbtA
VHSASEHAATAGEQEWAPGDGMERILYTSTATIAASIGFALLLIGGMLAAGEKITEQRAIAWAAAGFVATGLAPAAGVSPELPGMAAADLVSRQAWWFLTAALTALSIWLFLRTESLPLRVLAVALLVAPHVLGAPHLAEAGTSKVPAELAARFAAMSLAVQAALWVATGYAAGFFWQRLEPRPAASGASAQT